MLEKMGLSASGLKRPTAFVLVLIMLISMVPAVPGLTEATDSEAHAAGEIEIDLSSPVAGDGYTISGTGNAKTLTFDAAASANEYIIKQSGASSQVTAIVFNANTTVTIEDIVMYQASIKIQSATDVTLKLSGDSEFYGYISVTTGKTLNICGDGSLTIYNSGDSNYGVVIGSGIGSGNIIISEKAQVYATQTGSHASGATIGGGNSANSSVTITDDAIVVVTVASIASNGCVPIGGHTNGGGTDCIMDINIGGNAYVAAYSPVYRSGYSYSNYGPAIGVPVNSKGTVNILMSGNCTVYAYDRHTTNSNYALGTWGPGYSTAGVTITIKGGNINANTGINPQPRYTPRYGLLLYGTYVRVLDKQDQGVPDAKITVDVGSYIYTATADSKGTATVWLPVSSTVPAKFTAEKSGYYGVSQAAIKPSYNGVIIRQPTDAMWSESPADTKTYTTADLNLYTKNIGGGTGADIVSAEWFRTSAEDATNYENVTDFDNKYAATAASNKGDSDGNNTAFINDPGNSGSESNFGLTVNKNGTYWAKVKYTVGNIGETYTHYEIAKIKVDNIYVPFRANDRGAVSDGGVILRYLYGSANSYEPIAGTYGIPYDLDGSTILNNPSLGYDNIVLDIRSQYATNWDANWSASIVDGTEVPYTLTLDKNFLTNSICDNNDPSKYTIYYTKKATSWRDVNVSYVLSDGTHQIVNGNIGTTLSVPFDSSGNCTSFLSSGGIFVPEYDADFTPIGYYVGQPFVPANYVPLDDFSRFDPYIPSNVNMIYIVYEEDIKTIKEYYLDTDGNPIFGDTRTTVESPNDYNKSPRYILGYVPISFEISGAGVGANRIFTFDFDTSGLAPTDSQQDEFLVKISNAALGSNTTVTWTYEKDIAPGIGIPAPEGVKIDKRLTGHYTGGLSKLLSEKAIYSRKDKQIKITNDDSANGDANHKIPATTPPAQWIFDAKSSPAALITPAANTAVVFNYYYDTKGIDIPDKDQKVTEKYRLYGDYGNDLITDTSILNLYGDEYSKIAPEIPGYIAVGWYAGEYNGALSDNDIHHIARDVNDLETLPKTTATFTPDQASNTVTYIYKKVAEPVTIYWEGKTNSNNTIHLDKIEINGFSGEAISVDRDYVTLAAFWTKIDGEADTYNFTLGAVSQSGIFHFKEHKVSSIIKTVGKSLDGNLNYSTQIIKGISDAAFDVKAINGFEGYRVDGYVVEDSFGNVIASGNGMTVSVDPALGDQTVTFTYVSTITTLKIKAVNKNDPTEILSERVISDLTIGTTYSAVAPYIDDTWVLDGDVLKTTKIREGSNEIIFEYEKATGNATIILREAGTNIPIKVINEDYAVDAIFPVPNLSTDFYTAVDNTPISITFADLPKTYYIDYTKDLADVKIVPVDELGVEIPDVSKTLNDAARKGEMYTASAYPVKGYSLNEASSKLVYADGDTVRVEFKYTADPQGQVNIKHFYMDGGNRVYINESVVNGIVDSKLTVSAGAFDGYEFKKAYVAGQEVSGSSIEIEVSANPADNLIEFEYTDLRNTVTVNTKITGAALTTEASVTKYVSGSSAHVDAPYLANFLVVGYQVDGGAVTNVDPKTFTGLDLGPGGDLGAVTKDTEITFIYDLTEKVINTNYVYITIVGKEDNAAGKVLYSYDKRVARNPVQEQVIADSDIFNLMPKWKLIDNQDNKQTFSAIDNTTVEFYYENNLSSVTINAVDYNDGSNVINPINIPGLENGTNFSYVSPSVPGYQLVTSKGATTAPYSETITVGSDSDITFYYKVAKGNLIAKYVDEKGTEIGRDVYTLNVNDPTTITRPSIENYKSTDPEVSRTWDGANALVDVVYNYVKDTSKLTLVGYDTVTGNKITDAAVTISGLRVQEFHDYATSIAALTAKVPAGYTLVAPGSTSHYINTDSALNIVKVMYTPQQDGKIPVEVKANSTQGAILQSYFIQAAKGETVTISSGQAPNIEGYKYNESKSIISAKEGTNDKIILVMDDQRNELEVKYKVTGSAVTTTSSIQKYISGTSVYVAAPYFADHLIVGYQIEGEPIVEVDTKSFDGLDITMTTDKAITFIYDISENITNKEYVNLTIVGKVDDTNGQELYSYGMRVAKDSNPYKVIANSGVFDLRPTWALKAGENAKQTFAPTQDAIVEFFYENNTADLTIKMVEYDGAANDTVLSSIPIAGLEKGTKYSYQSPSMPNYQLVDKNGNPALPYIETVTVGAVQDITFYYIPATGNQTVIYVDENNVEIGRDTYDLPAGVEKEITLPAIEHFTTTDTAVKATFNGVDPLPDITYKYTKDTNKITLVAYDTVTGNEIPNGVFTSGALRVLELYDYVNDIPLLSALIDPSFTYSGQGSTIHHVSTDAALNVVKVWYSPAKAGEVPVEQRAETTKGAILRTYTIPASPGETVSILANQAPKIEGYEYDAASSIVTAKEGAGDKIILVYKDVRFDVSVAVSYGGVNYPNYDVYKVVSGGSLDVTVPYIPGYVLDTYKVGAAAAVDGKNTSKVAITNVTTDVAISFVYKTVDEASDEHFVNITIVGKVNNSQGAIKYQHVKRVPYSTNSATVIDASDVFDLTPKFKLIDGQDNKKTLTPSAAQTVEFYYKNNLSGVTINAVDFNDGSNVIKPIVIPDLENGKAYTHQSPSIPGYQLVTSKGATIAPYSETITVGSVTDITFHYKVAKGNLTARYVDEKGAEIGRDVYTLNVNDPTTITRPSIKNYTSTDVGPEESRTWDGKTALVDVVYNYAKDTSKLTLVGYDTVTGNKITDAAVTISGLRVQEYYDYSTSIAALTAKVPAGYTLVAPGSTSYYVSTDAALNVVKVMYTPQQDGKIPVEVRVNTSKGAILQSYFIQAAKGGSITLTADQAPDIAGYKLNAANSILTAKEGTADKIIFVMDDQRYNVSVAVSYGGINKPNYDMYKVASGGSLDITVPYIPGYVLDTYKIGSGAVENGENVSKVAITNVTTDIAISFVYKTVDKASDDNHVNVKVKGMIGTDEYYSYNLRLGENDAPKVVTANAIPNFTVTKSTVTASGGAVLSSGTSSTVTVDPADGDQIVEFTYLLKQAATVGAIKVKVTASSNGSALNGASVEILSGGAVVFSGNTNPAGELFYNNAPFGTYKAKVSYTGYDSAEVTDELTIANGFLSLQVALGKTTQGPGPGPGPGVQTSELKVLGVDSNGKEIYKDVTNQNVGNNVKIDAPKIEGYVLDDDESKSIVIATNSDLNVLTFKYKLEVGPPQEYPILEMDDHIPYIQGYEDGGVRPDGNLSRAEVAMIFYRLIVDSDKATPRTNDFSDVDEIEWYHQAISYLAEKGVLSGYPDGTFLPDKKITRAEFATIISKFGELKTGTTSFNDVNSDYWAYKEIMSAAANGWVIGYEDGSFGPRKTITRGEAVTAINRMLNRKIHLEDIPSDLKQFNDLTTKHWAYTAIMEASRTHDYTRKPDDFEIWSNY